MRYTTTQSILIFVVVSTLLILVLIFFIAMIIYRYQQKQNAYFNNIEKIKAAHDNTLLQSQVEMQEQTFQSISREIHDNIGQKLTLAKLQLNVLHYDTASKIKEEVNSIVGIIGTVISDLSDISRSMSSEIILQDGLIRALEFHLAQIEKSEKYLINFTSSGKSVFLDSNRELVLFRVAQEALHNILKHADASKINVHLHFDKDRLQLMIIDNGKGFNTHDHIKMDHIENELNAKSTEERGTGLGNMQKRINLLNGIFTVSSQVGNGTIINIEIPFV